MKITVAAITTPNISELLSNNGANLPICPANAIADMSPMKNAIPPTSGVGTGCDLRASGWAIQFRRRAIAATMGVLTAVVTAAHPPTIK